MGLLDETNQFWKCQIKKFSVKPRQTGGILYIVILKVNSSRELKFGTMWYKRNFCLIADGRLTAIKRLNFLNNVYHLLNSYRAK